MSIWIKKIKFLVMMVVIISLLLPLSSTKETASADIENVKRSLIDNSNEQLVTPAPTQTPPPPTISNTTYGQITGVVPFSTPNPIFLENNSKDNKTIKGNKNSLNSILSIDGTPSLTPSNITSTSITWNVIFPVSGQWYDRVEMYNSTEGWRDVSGTLYTTNGSYTATGLTPETFYMGRVTWYDYVTTTFQSIDITVTTIGNTIGNTPTLIAGDITQTSITWNAIFPKSGQWGNRIETYNILEGWKDVSGTINSTDGAYISAGLTPETSYMARLTWYDYGTSTYTSIDKVVSTIPITIPVLFADVTTPTNGNVTVTITFPADSLVKEYRINGGVWTAYSTPIVAAVNETIDARSVNAIGNISAISTLAITNIDKDVPAAPSITPDVTELTNGYVILEILSEVSNGEYRVGLTGDWILLPVVNGRTPIPQPLKLTMAKNDIVYTRATDGAGNNSPVGTYVVSNIDSTNPTVAFTTDIPLNQSTNQSITFTTYVSDLESGVKDTRYAFEHAPKLGKAKLPNPSAIYNNATPINGSTFQITSNGDYAIIAKDNVGNYGYVDFTINNIDKVAPTVPTLVPDKTTLTNTNVILTVTFSGDAAVKEYRVNSGMWTAYSAPVEMTANGLVEARGTDAVGNVSTIGSYSVSNIDKIAPTTPTLVANVTTPTNGNVTVTITFPADSLVKEYRINGGVWTAYSVPLIMINNGLVEARGTDGTGNISTIGSYSVTNIDKIAPTAPTITADKTTPTNGNVTVTITFSADSAVKEYRENNGTWTLYTMPIVFSLNGTVDARGTDLSGNVSNIETLTISNIDKVTPTTPMNFTSPSKTATTVNLAWIASTDNVEVTGYDIYNGGVLAATVTGTTYSIMGLSSGTIYNFTVQARDAARNLSTATPVLAVRTSYQNIDLNTPIDFDTPENGRSVYQFIPSNTENYQIYTDYYGGDRSSGISDTMLYIYSDINLTSQVANGYNDDSRGGTFSEVIVSLTKDQIYYVKVVGFRERKVHARLRVMKDDTAPSVPGNFVVQSQTDTSVTLSWTASTDNFGVIGYDIYNGGVLAATVTGTTYSIMGLRSGTIYNFTVQARDAARNLSTATPVLAVRTSYQNIDLNTPIDFDTPENGMSLYQFIPSNTGNHQIYTDYYGGDSSNGISDTMLYIYSDINLEVQVANGYNNDSRGGTFSEVNVRLNQGRKYYVKVAGFRGSKVHARLRVIKDDTAPSVPNNLVVQSKTDTSVTLSWTASTDNVAVTSYDIYNGTTLVGSVSGNTTSITLTGLTAKNIYSFIVKARDFAGNTSKASNVVLSYRYVYDKIGRIDYIQISLNQILKYNYDANGNLLWRKIQLIP